MPRSATSLEQQLTRARQNLTQRQTQVETQKYAAQINGINAQRTR